MEPPEKGNPARSQPRTARVRRLLAGKSWSTWIDLICVVILAIASLAAAWSGFQAAGWSGEQSALYARAGSARIESTRAANLANRQLTIEIGLFNGWAEAYVQGDTRLMAFYRNRMLPEVETALADWIATDPLNNPDAPLEPFVMPDFVLPATQLSNELEAEAASLFEAGQEANEESDRYVLVTVILAMVLFFGGLATRIGWRPAQVFTVALAIGLLIVSLGQLITYPLA
jgi:hypothetical protein